MAYGPNLLSIYHQTGTMVGRSWGALKPAHLSVERPPKFELVINLKTAKALGSPGRLLLLRADEVIE